MRDRKYFCYEIYKNLAIWSNNGQLGYNPCSFFKGYIKTTHIVAGGLNDNKPGHELWLDLTHMADIISWIISHPCMIPLIEIHANLLKPNK